jgi:hypothetical protein
VLEALFSACRGLSGHLLRSHPGVAFGAAVQECGTGPVINQYRLTLTPLDPDLDRTWTASPTRRLVRLLLGTMSRERIRAEQLGDVALDRPIAPAFSIHLVAGLEDPFDDEGGGPAAHAHSPAVGGYAVHRARPPAGVGDQDAGPDQRLKVGVQAGGVLAGAPGQGCPARERPGARLIGEDRPGDLALGGSGCDRGQSSAEPRLQVFLRFVHPAPSIAGSITRACP